MPMLKCIYVIDTSMLYIYDVHYMYNESQTLFIRTSLCFMLLFFSVYDA